MIYPNIQAEMERCGISEQELAEKAELSAEELNRKLSGKAEFTLDDIYKIAEVFNCSLDYLTEHKICRKYSELSRGIIGG